ncbi:MAG: precorrin-6A reductase [Butyrivibrio sp.]|nr:precorrin-6A reductase [Butyrivibrio sp.]
MSDKVLIFGGTTEGRELAAALTRAGVSHVVSVATGYGKEIENSFGEENVIVGRKNADEMAEFISSGEFSVCVDATHPFATLVSEEIKRACEKTGISYLRLSRDTGAKADLSELVACDRIEDAAKELEKTAGKILLLTGSKDLKMIMAQISDKTRVYARVLPNTDSIAKCEEAGLLGKQIIAMQGPFSKEMNVTIIKEIGASVILTKESGATGGLDEKILAARECGIKVVMVRSPESRAEGYADDGVLDRGYSLQEVLTKLGVELDKRIILAGMGPGDARFYTGELADALRNADVIFGAESILKRLDKNGVKAELVPLYMGKDILEFLDKEKAYKNPLALYSGDISLCSGAKSAAEVFGRAGYDVHKISGISSIALFANRLGIGLEDCDIVSAHGRECNVTGHIMETKKLIVLPSSCAHAGEIVRNVYAAVGECDTDDLLEITVGYELGTEKEKFFKVTEADCDNSFFSPDEKGKCLLYIENKKAGEMPVARGIADDEFIRGKTPMTKEEIRAISIRKLGLSADSVLWDIGAGTGSVSIEAALLHPDINVYAIERNDEAVELIGKNKEKFGAENVVVIKGEAPEALDDLPTPTHAFIGGSGGNMKTIIELLKKKNSNVRIVINCVTLETLTEVLSVIKEGKFAEPDIVQVSASRYRKVGDYHMADAINPVYIVTI